MWDINLKSERKKNRKKKFGDICAIHYSYGKNTPFLDLRHVKFYWLELQFANDNFRFGVKVNFSMKEKLIKWIHEGEEKRPRKKNSIAYIDPTL